MDVLINFIVVIIHNVYQIFTLYTLNIHSLICQLYLNETGGKKEWEEKT